MAHTAAGIYAGAMVLGVVEAVVPGGRTTSLTPAAAALAFAVLALVFGPRLPRRSLLTLGLAGVVLVGFAIGASHGIGDGASLYAWPVLWTACFFGVRSTVLIVVWTAVVHAAVLLSLPPGLANANRWLDVVGSVSVIAAVARNLSARNQRLVRELGDEARLDALTGLLNRRGFGERLAALLARAERDDDAVAVVVIDLDDFKNVNDRYGHDVGDRVLSWLGSVLNDAVRRVDLAARMGGDEFVLVLARSDEQAALRVAERVRHAVAEADPRVLWRLGVGPETALTISAGVVSARSPLQADQLLCDADHALYAAKHGGGDRVAVASHQALASR